jgi:CubicO group peptidase (beta-lactamase class C family)
MITERARLQLHTPESAGMDSARLARIDAIMGEFTQDDRLPGIMTLVQRRDKVVHLGRYGKMDIEAGRAMEEDALFRIYSMTKSIVSVAVMTLVDAGRLSLEEPVATFIPAFGKTKVYDGMDGTSLRLVEQQTPMKVYHLLTHTAGLSYGYNDSPVEAFYRTVVPEVYKRERTLEDVIETIAGIPLRFQPGTQWRYSIAIDVLGYLVQVAAGMPLEDYLRERIFEPLGMVDTGFVVPAAQVGRLTQLYRSAALYRPTIVPAEEFGNVQDVTKPTRSPAGGGGLVSTLADYLAFCNCLLHGGKYEGGRLLSRKTVEWMTSNHIPAWMLPLKMGNGEAQDYGFGMGFRVITPLMGTHSQYSVGAYGWQGGCGTYFLIDPAEDMILLLMTQHMPGEPYLPHDRFRNLVYQAIED